MHDVARHAGVSTATVSHVLNGTRFVSEETRRRVERAIAEMEYQPNLSARQLKTGLIHTVGFVVPDITNPLYASVILRVEERLARKNYSLLLVNTSENPQQEKAQLRTLGSHQVGGIILASTCERFDEVRDSLPDVPVMFFDRRLEGAPNGFVGIDAYQAYYDAIDSLLKRGHRKIGYLAGLSRLSTTRERISAYRNAFRDNRVEVDESKILHSDNSFDQTVQHTQTLLDAGCTVIVPANRKLTTNVVCYLCGCGIAIGRDIEIVGTTESTMAIPFEKSIHRISRPTEHVSEYLAEQITDCIQNKRRPEENFCCQAIYIPKETV